jgi:hypothetical protein
LKRRLQVGGRLFLVGLGFLWWYSCRVWGLKRVSVSGIWEL